MYALSRKFPSYIKGTNNCPSNLEIRQLESLFSIKQEKIKYIISPLYRITRNVTSSNRNPNAKKKQPTASCQWFLSSYRLYSYIARLLYTCIKNCGLCVQKNCIGSLLCDQNKVVHSVNLLSNQFIPRMRFLNLETPYCSFRARS